MPQIVIPIVTWNPENSARHLDLKGSTDFIVSLPHFMLLLCSWNYFAYYSQVKFRKREYFQRQVRFA